jgi:hypothetical protein
MRPLILVGLLSLSFASYAAERTTMLMHIDGGVAGTGPNFMVKLGNGGRLTIRKTSLPIVGSGRLSETNQTIRLTKADAALVIRLAKEADDFAVGCKGVPDGISATLVIKSKGNVTKRECWSGLRWPTGVKTQRLVNELNSHLAKQAQIE